MNERVLDVSNWDYDTLKDANLQCIYAAGIRRLIVGCWHLEVTTDIVMRARRIGFVVEDLYAFLYYGLAWEQRELNNALEVHRILGSIRRIWLDCEAQYTERTDDVDTEAPGITAPMRVALTLRARSKVISSGITPGIYTGFYWWRSNMGNTDAFKDDPLWIANYGLNDGQMQPITTLSQPFGGWTKASVHQYTSNVGLCGRSTRDWNYWNLEGDTMASEEYENVNARLERMELALFSGMESARGSTRAQRLTDSRWRASIIAGEIETPDGQMNRSIGQQLENLNTRVKRAETSGPSNPNAVLYGVPISIIQGRIVKDESPDN